MINPVEHAFQNQRAENARAEAGRDLYRDEAKHRFQEQVDRFVRLTREENYQGLDIYDWNGELIAGTEFKQGLGHRTFLFLYAENHAVVEAGEQCDMDYYEEDGVKIIRLLEPNIDQRIPEYREGQDQLSYYYRDENGGRSEVPAEPPENYQWHTKDIANTPLSPAQSQQVSLMAEDLRRRSDKIELNRL